MKKLIAFVLSLISVLTLFSCDRSTQSDDNQDTDDLKNSVKYEYIGYFLSLPSDCADSIIVNPSDNDEKRSGTLFEVFYKPAYEKAKQNGLLMGRLFTVLQLDRAAYEQYLASGDWSNQYAFGRDEKHYYIMTFPTDMQVMNFEDLEIYGTLSEICISAAVESVTSLNELSEYSDDDFWESSETYSGGHVYYRYYPYRAYPYIETEEDKNIFYTLMLSQPIKQGTGGIWCVERVYDDVKYGYIYAVFPSSENRTAIETYTELQASCDSGANQELLDPLSAALSYVQEIYGHANATLDSFEVAEGPPEGNFRF